MTYRHTLLTEVLKEAEAKKQGVDANAHRYEESVGIEKTHTPEHLTREGHLFEFMDGISKAIRGVKFAPRFACERWVYMPGEPYPMGWIGYGDYRTNTIGEQTFTVCSRKIANGKYGDYHDQHNMKMSAKLVTAVRNAKKFLSNYSPIEVARIHVPTMRAAIMDTRRDLKQKVTDDAQNIGLPTPVDVDEERGTLLNELRHLLDTGHEFVDVGYSAKLRTMFESMKEHDDVLGQVNANFVRGYERFGQQAFDVVPVDSVADYFGSKVQEEVVRYTDDLPEEIRGRVAVLSMLADETYVDGVGYRVNESMFYVLR
jgi:hypothetical protein